MDDYAERRRRELHESAVAAALATHDPKSIDSLRESETPQDEDEYESAPWN